LRPSVSTSPSATGASTTGIGDLVIATSRLSINFHGAMISPEDEVTSVTTTQSKSKDQGDCYITFQVSANNQRGETVVDYTQTFSWPEP